MRIASNAGISRALCLFAFTALMGAVHAQDFGRDSGRVTCESSGGRVTCDFDTRDGVRLDRQLGDAPCEEGRTWGFNERGVWVDRGCRAVFEARRRGAPISRI